MNKILILLTISPLLCAGQKLKIVNHANAIIFSGISSAQIHDSLKSAGFTVVDKDSAHFETLSRQYKVLEHGNLILKFERTDSVIIMTGICNEVAGQALLRPYGNKWRQARKTALGTVEGEAFNLMKEFAEHQPCRKQYMKAMLPPVETK